MTRSKQMGDQAFSLAHLQITPQGFKNCIFVTCFVQEQPRHLLCLNVVNMLNWGSRGTNRGSLTPHAKLKQSSHQCPTIPQFCSSRPQLPPGIYHAVTGGQRQVAQLLLLSSVCTVRLSGLRPSLQLINVLSHSKTES